DAEVENFELADADAGEDVAEAVIVADFGVFVGKAGVAGLGGEEAGAVGEDGLGCGEHAAAGGGDDFVSVEGEGGDVAHGAGRTVLVSGSEGFGGVFEDGD